MRLLVRMFNLAQADARPQPIAALRRQLRSEVRDTRLLALVRMRHAIHSGRRHKAFLNLAAGFVEDRNTFCRWQATIIVGEFIGSAPERVWKIARGLAHSPNPDVRSASTTVLLEHLLEYQSARMIPAFMAELDRGNHRFTTAVAGCANFASARYRKRVQAVIDRASGLTSA